MKNKTFRLIALFSLFCLSLLLIPSCGEKEADPSLPYVVEIDVEGYGLITAELRGDKAPLTVANFVSLAKSGFYDGLTFHRIMKGFMIQGGDPAGTGSGGSGKNIKGEFAANGVDNPLKHTRGALSMARSSRGYDTASSQFFIVHADHSDLDGNYAVFGYVTDGMEVVDKICDSITPLDKNGKVAEEDKPVIRSIKVIEKEQSK